jgi:hypothetical protein
MAMKKSNSKDAKAKKKPATKAAKPAAAEKKKSATSKPAPAKKAAPKTVKKTTTKTAAASKPAAAKTTAKKKQPSAPAQPTGAPMIDTNLAAQNAAAMLINRDTLESAATPPAAEDEKPKESSTFKNLKEQLARPKPSGLGGLLGPVGGEKKSSGHFFNQQKGHNQTYGGFNKTGVPRRTNG